MRHASCSLAIGGAAARTNGKVVLFEGDGSLLMHIQQLETIKRHRLKLLICVLNDGAYGAEIHKLRADGVDDSGAIFGRTDLAAIATCVPTGLFFFGQPPRGHTRTGQAPQRGRSL
jgi:acetolactate synthase-1/2/3 large subunit